jgi:CubicO group peptidase (beta-lactamase class C family)
MKAICRLAAAACLLTASIPLLAPGSSADLQSKVDAAVHEALTKTGVPSASVGIVRNGQIAFTRAYGNARAQPANGGETSLIAPVE